MSKPSGALVTNVADAPEETSSGEGPWASSWRVLTPQMRDHGGSLGVVQNRLPPGTVGCPFHAHQREDEVFFVLSGRGVLRYGDARVPLKPGDCVSCPAGTGMAHQIANPYAEEDLVYLAVGPYDPHEVCTYPDSGKVMVRALRTVGKLEARDYMDSEPHPPAILQGDPTSGV